MKQEKNPSGINYKRKNKGQPDLPRLTQQLYRAMLEVLMTTKDYYISKHRLANKTSFTGDVGIFERTTKNLQNLITDGKSQI